MKIYIYNAKQDLDDYTLNLM